LAAWEGEFKQTKDARNALADELATTYPKLVDQLTDLFTRINAFEAQLSRLHQSRPSGVSAHLAGVELEARQLQNFSRDRPSRPRAGAAFRSRLGQTNLAGR
jgi:hypothetical protein